jgi:hypothetical protein
LEPAAIEVWAKYRRAVLGVYPEGEDALPRQDVSEPELEEVVFFSMELTGALLVELGEGKIPPGAAELETAILAAAAVDFAVGVDVLGALGEEVEEASWGEEIPAAVLAAVPSPREIEPVESLLAGADDAFPEGRAMAGAALNLPAAQARTEWAIEELLGSAVPVASAFGIGLLTVGGTSLFSALGGFGEVHKLAAETRFGGCLHHGFKLISNAVRKLEALPWSESAAEVAAHLGLDELGAALNSGARALGLRVVGKVVRVEGVQERIGEMLRDVEEGQLNARGLDAELDELCRRFEKNMRWGGVIAQQVKRWAPLAIALGGLGPGSAAVAGANGVGLIYSLFSLAERLDTVSGWVAGVPMILERNL